MLLEKKSRPERRGRVNSFSKFQLPQVSKLDQSDLLSSVQSVGGKRDNRPPPSTRGFSALPCNPSSNSGKSEEGFSGGYNLVMAQVEERRRLQSLGLAASKKLAEPPISIVPSSPIEGPTVAKTRKRSSWQPPVNGKLQKSRSKSREARNHEPPTPTEFSVPHTFSRIHNAPPTPPPEPRERMAKEFVMPNALASSSDLSFSKPRPPFALATNSSTSSFAGSNASRSSLTSLTPSIDKSVYTLPPLSLGGLADVFTNEDAVSSKTGSMISLNRYSAQPAGAVSPVSPMSAFPPSPKFTSSPLTASPVTMLPPSSPLKRDLGHRKPSPPSAWKGAPGEDPEQEERGRSRYDRACHRYFNDDQDRRQTLRKMDNLPVSPSTTLPTHNSITPATTTGLTVPSTVSSTVASSIASTTPSAVPSTIPSTAPSLTASPATSRKASTTSTISISSGNVPKRYVRGEDIEKVNPVTRPYVEPAYRPALRIPSNNEYNMPPSPSPSPSPQRSSMPSFSAPSTQIPEAAASKESLLPPPPIPPRAPGRASRDSSLTRQTELRQVQTVSDVEDNEDVNGNETEDEIEEIAPLKPVRPAQVSHVPSIGDMMKELDDDDWSVLDGIERRPTLPRVPSYVPPMHKRHSELPSVARLPVRYMHNDTVGSLNISSGSEYQTPTATPKKPTEASASPTPTVCLPIPLPSPSIQAEDPTEDRLSPELNERAARVSRALARPAADQQSIDEKRKSTDSSKFKFLKFHHHRAKTQPVQPSQPENDPSDVTDTLLPPHERSDWQTSNESTVVAQSVRMALTRSQTGLPSPALTDASSSSLQLHLPPPSKTSASSSATSLTVPDDQSRSSKIKVFTICCNCHAWHDLPAKFYTVLFTKVAPVECIWCKHSMERTCCEAWSAMTNLVERHV